MGCVRGERYPTVFLLAARLVNGETIERLDEHGRRWRATASALYLVRPGTGELAPIVEGSTYDVAERLAGLR
jgi:hypothetical protein